MRILLSCYYFSPYRGGEAAVGWKYATGLAKLGHEVTVIYGDLSAAMPMKADVERYAHETGLPENLTAIHVAPAQASRLIHEMHAKPGLFFLYYPAYRLWQKANLREAARLHAAQPFDLAHHLTIIGYREPGYLWELGIPFFWGPINGAAAMPWGFIPDFGWKGRYQHVLRNVLNDIQMRLPSRSRKAAARAAKIWAVTEEDRRMVADIWGFPVETMIETGANPSEAGAIRRRDTGMTLKLVWCGLLEARKSLHLVLRAMATLPEGVDCELHVIGDGAERGLWQRLAENLGLGESVRWHGRVTHAEAQALMAAGHALIHSSVKEGTPHVVLEAMALGMPVICHDACGMGVAVDESSGLKVEMRDPKTSVVGFREAILRLWNEPGLLEKLSEGALARARELSWENKVEQVAAAYNEILAAKS
jgi:glycosyltransferase involved in cell wall biosynthesis